MRSATYIFCVHVFLLLLVLPSRVVAFALPRRSDVRILYRGPADWAGSIAGKGLQRPGLGNSGAGMRIKATLVSLREYNTEFRFHSIVKGVLFAFFTLSSPTYASALGSPSSSAAATKQLAETTVVSFQRQPTAGKASVAERVSGIESRVGNVELRLDNVELRLDNVEGSVKKLEGSVKKLEGSVEKLEGSVENLDGSVKKLEGSVNELRFFSVCSTLGLGIFVAQTDKNRQVSMDKMEARTEKRMNATEARTEATEARMEKRMNIQFFVTTVVSIASVVVSTLVGK